MTLRSSTRPLLQVPYAPELHAAVLLVQPYQPSGTIFPPQSLKQTVCLFFVVDSRHICSLLLSKTETAVNCNVASASVSVYSFMTCSFRALYKFVFNFNFDFIERWDHDCNYYPVYLLQRQSRVPVKWMAPESLAYNVCTIYTDVLVAFILSSLPAVSSSISRVDNIDCVIDSLPGVLLLWK